MSARKKIVVFSGAGMSAESGIQTFRDSGGLWEKYRIEDVATPDAWHKNPELVLDFYNQRRKQIIQAQPNEAHRMVAQWQEFFDVQVITQNIDDLHERAGSKKVLHLHGEIMKARSTRDPDLLYPVRSGEIRMGDVCETGAQLRPHIVWFGELVPEMENAALLVSQAEIFVTIGTSLNVYPAAGLISVSPDHVTKYLVDPGTFNLDYIKNLSHIKMGAVDGIKHLTDVLKALL
ncbi:MAG: NAD-dependent deacylase [Bacteroidetes bacterium]|nr:NAD-dependent deacylase [Bacteroidota bacterium]